MARDWPAVPRPPPRRPVPRRLRTETLLYTLLSFASITGFSLALDSDYSSERSSSPAASPPNALPADAAELVRDAPLYPPLQHTPSDASEDLYELDTVEESKTTIQHPEDYKHQYNDIENKPAIYEPKNFDIETNAVDNKLPVERTPDVYEELETSIEENRLVDEVTVETEDATKVQNEEERVKRSSGKEWERPAKSGSYSTRRVKTGDTILNIRGAVRDAIGDAGAAPGPRHSSRLDTFVIRPAQPQPHHAPSRDQPRLNLPTQAPKYDRELLVEAHARARIPCDVSNSSDVRWYKDNEAVNAPEGAEGGSGAEGVWRERGGLVVGRATRGDAGFWRCAATDRSTGKTVSGKPTRLLIYEPVRSVYLAVDGRRLDAGNTWVPVRDKTELEVRCVAEGGVPPPELSWRLLALEPALDHRPYLRIHHTNYSIEGVSVSHAVVTAARELHNATLQCEARQRRPAPPSPPPALPASPPALPAPAPPAPLYVLTAKLEIHVTYPPSFVISRWPGFGVSLSSGGAAALRCDVDANPPARAWWLRDDANPTSSPPPLEAGDESARGSATLRWAALRAAHAGWYRCRATWLDTEYSSIGYYLNVISSEEYTETVTETEQAPEEPDHQKVEIPLGGNVQMHCPKGSVGCWWRRVVGNASDTWAPAGSHHAHGVLGIKDALYQEGGEYRCVGAQGPDLMRLRELKRVTLKITGGATATALSAEPAGSGWRLECGACGRGVRVLWLRAGSHAPPAPAPLAPDLAQHCWRAVLHVTEPDEVWCVAATPTGGAVAVFPRRAPRSPPALAPASPAPARHTVRALHNGATVPMASYLLMFLVVLMK